MRARLLVLFSATGRRVLVLATLAVVLYLAALIVAKTLTTYTTYQDTIRLRADIQRLQERYARLEALRDYELSDDFVEQIARRQLNLIKPGERAVIVIAPTPAPAEVPTPVEEQLPWWRGVLGRLWPQTP